MIIKAPLQRIGPNPYQPESRLNVSDEVAERFGRSILEHGLLQIPVARLGVPLVNPDGGGILDTFEMGDGWLRLSGFKWLVRNGHPEYNEMRLDVRDLTDRQMADMILEANTVRKDMTPIDEAKLYKKYLEDFGVTQTELAKSHNLTQGALANKLRLLELPAEIQDKIISQEISETHGRHLLKLNYNPKLQKTATADAVKCQMTVDQLSNYVARVMYLNSRNMETSYHEGDAPEFDASHCEGCKSRQKIGNPYDSSRKSWRCLDEKCWDKKQLEAEKKRQEEIAAKAKDDSTGTKILTSKDVNYNQKEDLNDRVLKELDNPEECATCSKTALYKYSHDSAGAPTRICLNPSCFRAKKSKKTREIHAKEKKQDQELTGKIVEAFSAMGGTAAVRNCLLVLALDNLSGLTNQDAKNDILQFFPQFPTDKGKLDIEATKKSLYASRAVWATDDLVRICAAAIITRQRRQYSGSLSPKLTGKVKKDYALLTGTMDDFLAEIKAFEAANCQGCGHVKKELLGTGEDCCQAPYYRQINDEGVCTGKSVEAWNDVDKSEIPAADPGEDDVSCPGCDVCTNHCEDYGQEMGWKCKVCGCTDDMGCMTDNGPCYWVAPNLCSACEDKVEDKEYLRKQLNIPAGIRFAEDVSDFECRSCRLQTEDHTVGSKYRVGNTSYKVCLKDYRAKEGTPAAYTPTLEPPCGYCARGPDNGGSCDTSLYHCADGPGSVLVCEEMKVKPC